METARCMVCEDAQEPIEREACDDCITEDGKYICPECNERKETLASLRQHCPPAHDVILLNNTCDACGDRFNGTGSLCSGCGEKYTGDASDRVSITCEHCKESFKVPPYEAENKNPKFCSQECYHEKRRDKREDKSEEARNYHPKRQGERSEAATMLELHKRGVTVLEPRGDSERYDFVVDTGEEFVRMQSKTANEYPEDGKFTFECASTNTTTAKRDRKEDYRGDAEYFIVYNPEQDQVYLVPVAEAPIRTMTIRYAAPDNPSPNINWAENYLLENRDEIDEWAED